MSNSHNISSQGGQQHIQPTTPHDSNHLSPFATSHLPSNSASPTQNNTSTPAESISTLSHYQSSDFSDLEDVDPFFGANFSNVGVGTPSFLDDPVPGLNHTNSFGQSSTLSFIDSPSSNHMSDIATYPLSPDPTVSLHTLSPRSERKASVRTAAIRIPDSISPQELQKPFKPSPVTTYSTQSVPQLTPSHSGSGRSSEDGLAPAAMVIPAQSPRVTISLWDKNSGAPVHTVERTFTQDGDGSPTTVRGGVDLAGDLITSTNQMVYATPAPRDEMGNWQRDPSTGHRGLDPESRTSDEVQSVNEILTKREIEERNQEVGKWLAGNEGSAAPERQDENIIQAFDKPREADANENRVPLGMQTENKYVNGQTYFLTQGGEVTQEDINIINANRNWADAPMLFHINSDPSERYQPETSQAAIARFNRLCQDNESIISKAATWGTRRRSLPSLLDVDIEAVTSGNILKKLSLSRGDGGRRPSFLNHVGRLVRKPSANLKRSRSGHDEATFSPTEASNEKRDSIPHLAPPTRTSSWGITKKPTPSINTALVAMGGSVASIGGGQHARGGSISAATPVTSPKSPMATLKVGNSFRRQRSKSDLPRPGINVETHSNLVDMWKRTGGPPVASLAKTAPAVEADEDDDDEDDLYEDSDMKIEASKMIDDITPTFSGFQQHVLRLNPSLATANNYLVDRIAHQQIVRYKTLSSYKVRHLQQGANCPCGILCVALGGTANIIDQKGDPRGVDPLSARYDGSDGDITPIEGAITTESFPVDIPMPPATSLPAEFECQLCFQAKKFQKPSDWTKHVHEDVQPFTCTWDRCRDPKIFKRKADWVRHENEGHRHLEWWTCDVDDCRHTCYRRDNFLQHLVREHKFPEPKVKTKAAMKRAGGIDPTWQKVEKCHKDTDKRPQEEPCRFCGKSLPSWKKLTVHLAKHMEQISLPVLRLVEAKELDADTIISPVQDPPPRPFIALPIKREHSQQQQSYQSHQFNPNAAPQMMSSPGGLTYLANSQGPYRYPVIPNNQFPPVYYNHGYDSISQNLDSTPIDFQGVNHANPAFSQHQQYQNISVTTAGYVTGHTQYSVMPQNVEPFPSLDTNALDVQTNVGGPAAGQMNAHLGNGMGYDSLMEASATSTDPYTSQGSVSPYSHSPHQGQGGFYPPQ
jgi:hypothetical protein